MAKSAYHGYGDRRQRGNKKFRRKIVREINLLAHQVDLCEQI